MRHLLLFTTLLATTSLLLAPVPTNAQVFGYRLHVPFLFPVVPSIRDERWLVIVDDCGEGRLQEPVVLRQQNGAWRLEATPVSSSYLCFAVTGGPGTAVHAIRIRTEQLQTSSLDVSINAQDGRGFEGQLAIWGAGTQMPPSVDGAWHDPNQPGQGLYLQLTPMQYRTGVVSLWSTYDRTGAQMWLTGAALNDAREPYVVNIPLYSTRGGSFPGTGQTAPTVDQWGQLRLEYLGCHRLKVDWQARDVATFPPGSREFRQFTTDVSHECDIEAFAASIGRDLFRYEPQIIRE